MDSDIAAFIDGELSASDELIMDEHFVACAKCSAELNSQKDFLRALDISLEQGGEVSLPTDFVRTVVVNAESRVNGLRRPGERKKAIFVFAVMTAATMLIVGDDRSIAAGLGSAAFERTAAVLGFAWHFLFDMALAVVVVFRSLAAELVFASPPTLGLFVLAFAVSMYGISRLMLRNTQV